MLHMISQSYFELDKALDLYELVPTGSKLASSDLSGMTTHIRKDSPITNDEVQLLLLKTSKYFCQLRGIDFRHIGIARIFLDLGRQAAWAEDFNVAKKRFVECLTQAETAMGVIDHPVVSCALHELGKILFYKGDFLIGEDDIVEVFPWINDCTKMNPITQT